MSAGAGGAGGGAGAAGNAAGGGDAGGEAQANGGPDVGALADQLSQMSAAQEEMRNYLMSQPQQQQAQQADEGFDAPADDAEGEWAGDDSFDLGERDAGFGPDGTADDTAGELADVFQRHSEQQLAQFHEQHVAPLQEEVQRVDRERQWGELANEFPEAGEHAEELFDIARQLAEAQDWPAEVATSPHLIRLIYLAGAAVKAQADEDALAAEPDNAAHLEGGAGAGQAGGQQLDAISAALTGQGGRHASLPFPG